MQSETKPQSTFPSTRVLSQDPAPLSRLLGLPVLTSDPTPLSSALNLNTPIRGLRDLIFGARAQVRAFNLGSAAVYSETSEPAVDAPAPGSSPNSSGYIRPESPWAHFSKEDMYAGIVIAVMILGPLVSAPHH